MQSSRRQRVIINLLLATLALFALDRLALSPYLEMRDDLIHQLDSAANDLTQAHHILQLQDQLRPLSRAMSSALTADPSAVESRLLHLLHEWQQTAGVANASFGRLRSTESHGFTCLTFDISATGGMAPIAALLYRIETPAIPLRIDQIHITPKRDGTDDLQLNLSLSTLCRAASPAPAPTAVANLSAVGGQD